MKYSLLMLVGIVILIFSASFIAISFNLPYFDRNVDVNDLVPLPTARPSNEPTIAFSTSYYLGRINSYVARTIIFNVNGTYDLYDNSTIQITDTTGSLVYSYPIRSVISLDYNGTGSFPIRIVLEREGNYVASINNVKFDNDTFLMAYELPVQFTTMTPFNQNLSYLLVTLGFTSFSIGWILVLNPRKHEVSGLFVEDKTLTSYQESANLTVATSALLILYALLIAQTFTALITQVAITAILIALVLSYAFFSFRKIKGISNLSYERIRIIETNSRITIVISSIFLLLALVFFFQNNALSALGLILYIIGFVLLCITAPYFSILTTKGRLVLPLTKFCKDYNCEKANPDFTLLAIASKRIKDYYKSIGITLSQSTLTIGMFNYIITKHTTLKIEELKDAFLGNLSPEVSIKTLKYFISEGCETEKIKIKALPSFFERYSRQVTYIASILAIVTTAIAIFQFILSISNG